ncbi:unnamed protein product [Symbiodinium natans]|uniref:Uncharacterized protein n=1 Tax=Symbiodinium natans TaxID=878477 RepID=A0A812QXG1_9DINO|nr:unnamed protein product [Symbiodinium natans]
MSDGLRSQGNWCWQQAFRAPMEDRGVALGEPSTTVAQQSRGRGLNVNVMQETHAAGVSAALEHAWSVSEEDAAGAGIGADDIRNDAVSAASPASRLDSRSPAEDISPSCALAQLDSDISLSGADTRCDWPSQFGWGWPVQDRQPARDAVLSYGPWRSTAGRIHYACRVYADAVAEPRRATADAFLAPVEMWQRLRLPGILERALDESARPVALDLPFHGSGVTLYRTQSSGV